MSRLEPGRREKAERDWRDAQKHQLERAFAHVLSTPEGRLFVRWLLMVAQWDLEPMTGNSQTFHTLGRQSVGREMRDTLIAADRAAWRLLEDEAWRDADLALSLRNIPD